MFARPIMTFTTRPALTRTLFTLPDLSSLSPFYDSGKNPEEPQRYHERKILPYRPSELYNIVADVASYPTFVPFCTRARILTKSTLSTLKPTAAPSSVNSGSMDAELTVGFLSFQESYVSKVTCCPNESVEAVASSSTPLFTSLSTTWQFQPAPTRSPHPNAAVLPSNNSPSNARHSSTSSPPTPQAGSLKDSDSGPTLVTLDLAFAFANPVHAAVSAAFFGQVSKMMVKAFEERCLEVYGPGRR